MKKAKVVDFMKAWAVDNALKQFVVNDVLNHAESYTDNDNDFLGDVWTYCDDVMRHGCVSGLVSCLIYYRETLKFYEEYKNEINTILYDFISETGLSLSQLFWKNWDDEDPLALDTHNQNLLAWFGYEETIRQLQEEVIEALM